MTEPRTAAGLLLLDHLMSERFLRETTEDFEWTPEQGVVDDILAIEAEAATLDVERLARAIQSTTLTSPGEYFLVSEDDLAAIASAYQRGQP